MHRAGCLAHVERREGGGAIVGRWHRRRDRCGEDCLVPFLTDPSSILSSLTITSHQLQHHSSIHPSIHPTIQPSIMHSLWGALGNSSVSEERHPLPSFTQAMIHGICPCPAPDTIDTALGPVCICRGLSSIQPGIWLASGGISFLGTDLVGMVAKCIWRAPSLTVPPTHSGPSHWKNSQN